MTEISMVIAVTRLLYGHLLLKKVKQVCTNNKGRIAVLYQLTVHGGQRKSHDIALGHKRMKHP